MRRILGAAGALAAAGAAWSLFEAQWVERVELATPVAGLPPELEGFRILHLSDFHLGTVSLNGRALERAVRWGQTLEPDLVAITGDLLTRRRGEPALREAVGRLRARHGVLAVLGNHDVAESRDPFAQPTDASSLDGVGAVLLDGSARSFEAAGRRVQIVGVSPRAYARAAARPHELADAAAELRILLCHFPGIVDRVPPGVFHLVLAGHMHGGQICLPAPWGKVHLEHLRARYWEGLHRRPGGTLYVSRGLGTSFVPFRLLARPEATLLTLIRAD